MKKLIASLVAALTLSACSGGGGYGGASIPAVPNAPILQPAQSVARTQQDWGGTLDGYSAFRLIGGVVGVLTASASGTVQSQSGGPVAGAIVTASLALKPVRVSATTDANGAFTLPGLATGAYTLTVDNTNATGQSSSATTVAGPKISINGLNLTGITITD